MSETFSDMRDFYAEDNYKILRDEKVYEDLETLAKFWDDVATRNERFSSQVLKRLYVLSYSPYSVWSYVVSLYFMSWRDLDEEDFCRFLDKITAMILINGLLDFGKQTIRRPFVLEFKNIYNGEPIKFEQYRQRKTLVRSRLHEMKFSNTKPITRAMLAWWTFQNPAQDLPPLGMDLHLEHIYAKNRHETFQPLEDADALECLGNKTLCWKNELTSARRIIVSLIRKNITWAGNREAKNINPQLLIWNCNVSPKPKTISRKRTSSNATKKFLMPSSNT